MTGTLGTNKTSNLAISGRARSASCSHAARARVAKSRVIDLNDPSMLEVIRRDGRVKQPTALDHVANRDNQIFTGLDNSKLLSDEALAKKTYKEIFTG